jgi:hypothetical protein
MNILIQAIRNDKLVGWSSGSAISMCVSDEELHVLLEEEKITTEKDAIEWAREYNRDFGQRNGVHKNGWKLHTAGDIANIWFRNVGFQGVEYCVMDLEKFPDENSRGFSGIDKATFDFIVNGGRPI